MMLGQEDSCHQIINAAVAYQHLAQVRTPCLIPAAMSHPNFAQSSRCHSESGWEGEARRAAYLECECSHARQDPRIKLNLWLADWLVDVRPWSIRRTRIYCRRVCEWFFFVERQMVSRCTAECC